MKKKKTYDNIDLTNVPEIRQFMEKLNRYYKKKGKK